MNYSSSVTASVLCLTAILVRSCPLWVISCRDAVKVGCPLYPRKLPRLSPTGASAKGQQLTCRRRSGAVWSRSRTHRL